MGVHGKHYINTRYYYAFWFAFVFYKKVMGRNLILGKCAYSSMIFFLFLLSSVQSLSRVQHFVTPWTAACQASLSFTTSRSLVKLMSIALVMPSNHLIPCHPLFFLPSSFPCIRVFSSELVLCSR